MAAFGNASQHRVRLETIEKRMVRVKVAWGLVRGLRGMSTRSDGRDTTRGKARKSAKARRGSGTPLAYRIRHGLVIMDTGSQHERTRVQEPGLRTQKQSTQRPRAQGQWHGG